MSIPKSSSEERKGAVQNSRQTWCKFASILEVEVVTAEQVPFEPPISQYMEEVLMGLRDGRGDKNRSSGQGEKLERHMETLTELIGFDFTKQVFSALFWMTIGGIFGVVSQDPFESFQETLGQAWNLLAVQVLKNAPKHRKMCDWIFQALPHIIAQVIYRILYDGFSEDRKNYFAQSGPLLDKITRIVHYHLTGFRLLPETVKKDRRQIFLHRVIKTPHTNQIDFLKGLKMQEILEIQNVSNKDKPLAFGKEDGAPLPDPQLGHVLKNRSDALPRNQWRNRRGSIPAVPLWLDDPLAYSLPNRSGTASSHAQGKPLCKAWPPPDELSLDRHDDLVSQGEALLVEQLTELAHAMGEDPPEAEVGDGDASEAPSSPASPSPPSSPLMKNQVTWSPRAADKGGIISDPLAVRSQTPETEPESPNSTKRGKMSRFTAKASMVGKLCIMRNDIRKESQERLKKMRKLRQEELQAKIMSTSLLDELCTRELCTTWVSPVTHSLVPEAPDKFLLRKRFSENFRLKMEAPKAPTRTLSLPTQKMLHSSQASDKRRLAQDAATVSGASLREEGSIPGSRPSLTSASHSRSVAKSFAVESQELARDGTSSVVSANMMLPRVPSAGQNLSMGTKTTPTGGEVISLAPPAKLSSKQITQRIEAQANAFQQRSFSEYKLCHDIVTGEKVRRIDAYRLEDEEQAYVRRMESLVGGPPKRMIKFGSKLKRMTAPSEGKTRNPHELRGH